MGEASALVVGGVRLFCCETQEEYLGCRYTTILTVAITTTITTTITSISPRLNESFNWRENITKFDQKEQSKMVSTSQRLRTKSESFMKEAKHIISLLNYPQYSPTRSIIEDHQAMEAEIAAERSRSRSASASRSVSEK